MTLIRLRRARSIFTTVAALCGSQILLDVFNRDFSRYIDLSELGGYFAGIVLGDGPGGISGEPEAAGIIEFFDGPHKR